ncbi:hypothetical protein MTO96_027152 [Rhipicephalus appendiculatus]
MFVYYQGIEKYSFGNTVAGLLVVVLRQHQNKTNVICCNGSVELHDMSPAALLLKATFMYSRNMVTAAHTFKPKLFITDDLVLLRNARQCRKCLCWLFGNVYD